jgi:hypothetical protein
MKSFCTLAVLVALASLPGTIPAQEPASPPNVVGVWAGTWSIHKVDPAKVPPKALDCIVVRKADVWEATFEGECGRPYKYTIKMEGRQAGGVVLFKGTVDLGPKDGGVFDWIGRANDTEFVGFYTSGRYTGSFQLQRKKETAAK